MSERSTSISHNDIHKTNGLDCKLIPSHTRINNVATLLSHTEVGGNEILSIVHTFFRTNFVETTTTKFGHDRVAFHADKSVGVL